jgi:predicted SAM-dependent methyltransferase
MAPAAGKGLSRMTREDALRAMFKADGFGLEIGGSHNPLVPKSAGFNVETLDHCSQDDLIEKYRNDPKADFKRIEAVDYVCDGASILDAVGKPDRYDFIVASHVIEHTTDLIGFLRDCGELLRADGVLVLAVPDKRYCFDVLRPVSTTGAAVQAYREGRTRHPPGVVFDNMANRAARGGDAEWWARDTRELRLVHSLKAAVDHFDAARSTPAYIDAHEWCFTPSSFRLLLRDFNELGFVELRESAFRTTDRFEFFVVLSRNGPGYPLGRLDLLKAVEAELAEAAEKLPTASTMRQALQRAQTEPRPGDLEGHFATSRDRDAYLEAVLSSTSWRITRPLRTMSRIIRQFRPKS